tara:strand:+ start:121 stop:867 length:747 start_codon:yes stop_codon:yes gene_type:complete
MTKIFVGYDNREDMAYRVCHSSILKNSPHLKSSDIIPLKHQSLRDDKKFWRTWRIDEDGQYWDEIDGRPFSTEFSFTRFLVPELARRNGISHGPVVFVDCDFLFVGDIQEMIYDHYDPNMAVSVVKHNYKPKSMIKMDNKIQINYNMKLWSSLMIFNMDHPDNSKLNLAMVNSTTGSHLHQFGWLSSPEFIGDIDPSWNYIGKEDPAIKPNAIHYTEGGPWFAAYRDCPFADLWLSELESLNSLRIKR